MPGATTDGIPENAFATSGRSVAWNGPDVCRKRNGEFRDNGVKVNLRLTRYDSSDPEHWWRHRGDIRYVMSELQKLVVYRLGVGG